MCLLIHGKNPAKLKPNPDASKPMVGRALRSFNGLGVSVGDVSACVISVGVGLMMPVFKNLLELDAPKTFCVGLRASF